MKIGILKTEKKKKEEKTTKGMMLTKVCHFQTMDLMKIMIFEKSVTNENKVLRGIECCT